MLCIVDDGTMWSIEMCSLMLVETVAVAGEGCRGEEFLREEKIFYRWGCM